MVSNDSPSAEGAQAGGAPVEQPAPQASPAPAAHKPASKTRQGVVVKAKMQKSVVVEVSRRVRHGKYVKFITSRKRFMAHDEAGARPGDTVVIEETRPLSKLKRWRVKEIVTRATGA
jgi:small subunit ribosomal protein S17